MSIEYYFYLARKTGLGLKVVGPAFLNVNDEYEIMSIWRTKSSIDLDEFEYIMDDLFLYDLDPVPLTYELLTYENEYLKERRVDAYYCGYEELRAHSKNRGFRIGYLPLEDMDEVIKNNYQVESKYDYDLLSPEIVAEMADEERKKYGKIAYYITSSFGFLASQLVAAFEQFVERDDAEYYVICNVQ